MPELKSPLKRWGGKGANGMARWVVSHFPDRSAYDTFLDGCFGTGAVTLAHDPADKSEIACDKDRTLTNFWWALQNPKTRDELLTRLQLVPFSEVEFEAARSRLNQAAERMNSDRSTLLTCAEADVGLAADFFIVSRQSYVGRCDAFAALTKSRLRRGMNEQVSALLSSVDRLPEIVERMLRVLVLAGPIEDRLLEFNRPRVLIYLDPPYFPDTRTDPDAYGPNDTDPAWHMNFLSILTRMDQAQVIVSGNPSEEYDKALLKWRRVSRKVADSSSSSRSKRVREEVLWMNYFK